jgi:predicted dehydrogenase
MPAPARPPGERMTCEARGAGRGRSASGESVLAGCDTVAMRIGILGAARIAPSALVKPARAVEGVEVAAVAARDRRRAEAFAARYGIATVHDSYPDVLADASLDAVYIPLPNGLHAEWMLAAIKAGKHVLCEKPFTSNAAQARAVAAAADGSGLVVMEAFHYRYHPLARRMHEIAHGGELGRIERVETAMCFPLPRFSDIRYDFDLAGGALMDAGCYAVHCLRLLSPGEPTVAAAKARTMPRDRRIDRAMTAVFRLPGGGTGLARASMWSSTLLRIRARVVGEHGTMTVNNFVVPQLPSRFTVTAQGRRRRERFGGEATYVHQLRAFHGAVEGAATNLTPPSDSVATMTLVDDIYRAAGLPVRGHA